MANTSYKLAFVTAMTAIAMVAIVHAASQDALTLTLTGFGNQTTGSFQIWKANSARAIFVVVPGFSRDSDRRDEDEQEWKAFASSQNISLMAASFAVKGSNTNARELALRTQILPLLLKATNACSNKPLPLFIIATDDDGADIALSLLSSAPTRFTAWCSRSSKAFKLWPRLPGNSPPGIILTQSDSLWYDDAYKTFLNRPDTSKRTWLSVRPIDYRKAVGFARTYLEFLIGNPNVDGTYIADQRQLPKSTVIHSKASAAAIWLPNQELAQQWSDLNQGKEDVPVIHTELVDMSQYRLPNFSLYWRLPRKRQDRLGVDGVLAFCTWIVQSDNLQQALLNNPDQLPELMELPSVQMVRYAESHNLALLTWSTPGRWRVGENADELSALDRNTDDLEFDRFSSEWNKTVTKICKTNGLPESGFLLYGMSRGAQWAHRLALRCPERFSAVAVHVSSSYDIPTAAASRLLWLVTTGELDPGRDSSVSFFEQCKAARYRIIFKEFAQLQHEMRPDVDRVRDAFFDYALTRSKNPTSPLSGSELKYIADYQTGAVLPAAKGESIPPERRVYLPTDQIAAAWPGTPPGPSITEVPRNSNE